MARFDALTHTVGRRVGGQSPSVIGSADSVGNKGGQAHPGAIFDTNLQRSMNVPRVVLDVVAGISNLLVLKSIPQGAATQCYVATNPALDAVSGQYFADCNIAKPRSDARRW